MMMVSWYVRSLRRLLSSSQHFQLDSVDSIDAVNEEDEDEDKGDSQPIHQLGDDGVSGDEAICTLSITVHLQQRAHAKQKELTRT